MTILFSQNQLTVLTIHNLKHNLELGHPNQCIIMP